MFTLKYNRTTNHIDGLATRTPIVGDGEERGGAVPYSPQKTCGSLTRYTFADGQSFESLRDALDAARKGGRKLCKTCEAAAVAELEAIANGEGGNMVSDTDTFETHQNGTGLPITVNAEQMRRKIENARAHGVTVSVNTGTGGRKYIDIHTGGSSYGAYYYNNDTKENSEMAAKKTTAAKAPAKASAAEDERAKLREEIDGNIERVRSLAEAENAEGVAELAEETESMIAKLPVGARPTLRATLADASQAKPEAAAIVPRQAPASLATKDFMEVEGVPELIGLGAERIAQGVESRLTGTELAKQIAGMSLDMWSRLTTKDGVPDLKGASDEAKKATSKMKREAGGMLKGEDFDVEQAVKSLFRSVQDQRTDVRAEFLRSLDADDADGAATRERFAKVLENKPADVPASVWVADYYKVSLEGTIEARRRKYAERKELEKAGKAAITDGSEGDSEGDGEGGAAEASPDDRIKSVVDRLTKSVRAAKPEDFEAASEETRETAREELNSILKAVRAMIKATLDSDDADA